MVAVAALPRLFDELLATEPDLPALVQDGRTTTFAGWWADSSLIASGLAAASAGRRDVVLLMLASGQDFASCYLSALRLGAIVSAVNPRLGPTETAHIIAQCEPAVIVADDPGRVPDTARVLNRERILLADAPLCPFRTGRQPSRDDRTDWTD